MCKIDFSPLSEIFAVLFRLLIICYLLYIYVCECKYIFTGSIRRKGRFRRDQETVIYLITSGSPEDEQQYYRVAAIGIGKRRVLKIIGLSPSHHGTQPKSLYLFVRTYKFFIPKLCQAWQLLQLAIYIFSITKLWNEQGKISWA